MAFNAAFLRGFMAKAVSYGTLARPRQGGPGPTLWQDARAVLKALGPSEDIQDHDQLCILLTGLTKTNRSELNSALGLTRLLTSLSSGISEDQHGINLESSSQWGAAFLSFALVHALSGSLRIEARA